MTKPILKFSGSKPAPEFFEHKNVEYNTSNKNKIFVNNKNFFLFYKVLVFLFVSLWSINLLSNDRLETSACILMSFNFEK